MKHSRKLEIDTKIEKSYLFVKTLHVLWTQKMSHKTFYNKNVDKIRQMNGLHKKMPMKIHKINHFVKHISSG